MLKLRPELLLEPIASSAQFQPVGSKTNEAAVTLKFQEVQPVYAVRQEHAEAKGDKLA